MNITSISSQQVAPQYLKNLNTKPEAESSSYVVEETAVNTKPKDSSALYKELSAKYDVRNSTFDEMVEISTALYEAGEISLLDHSFLTFDFERAEHNLRRLDPSRVSADFSLYETPTNAYGQRDWIAEFKARAEKKFSFGNLIGHQHSTKISNILERLSR